MIGGDLVTTAAHVVAGATHIEVRFGSGEHAATIAAIDTRADLAVLRVEGLRQYSVELRSATGTESGAYVGYGGAEPMLKQFSIKRRIILTSQDIYGNGNYPRAAYDVAASVATGDSGGGLFVDGALTGVMWARSQQTEQQAYAIDISEFRPLIAGIEGHTLPSIAGQVPCR
jgi:S1-C subfamily serine protease